MPLYVPHVIHSFLYPTPVGLWCGVRSYLLLNKLQFFWRAPNRIRKCWYLCENVNTPTAVLGPHFFVSLMLVSCPVLFCRWDGDVRRRWERTSLSALVCAADCGRRLQIYYWGHWAKSEDRLFITVIHHPATKKEQHFCGEWPCVWKVLFSDLIRWLNPELSIPLLFLLSCGRDENWHQQQSTFYLQEITLCGWTLCALIWNLQFAYLCPIYSHSGTSLLIYDAPEPPNVNMLLMWEILDVGCELDTCALLCSVRCGYWLVVRLFYCRWPEKQSKLWIYDRVLQYLLWICGK